LKDVVKKEILKLLDANIIYPIFDSTCVDKAKIDVMIQLQSPKTVKDIRSFLGHAGFYRRFIKDFSKIA